MHIGHGQVAKQCKQKQKTKKIPGDPVNWQRIRRLFFTTFLMFWWYTLSMFTSTAGLCCYSHNFSHSHVLRSTWSAYSWPDGDFLVFLFVFYFGRLCSGLTSISVSFIVTISVSVLCARSRNWWLSCFAYNHPEDRTIQFCLSRFFIHSHRLWASLCDRSSALIICWSSVSIGDTVVSALYTPQRGLLLPWRPAIAWNIHHRRIPTHRTFTARGGGEEEGWVHTMIVISPKPKTLCRWRDINSNRVAVNDKKQRILSRNTLLFAHWLVSLTHNTSFVVRYSFSLAARVNRMNGPRVWQRSSICYFFVARRIYYGLVGSFTWQCANNLLYIHHWGAESAC